MNIPVFLSAEDGLNCHTESAEDLDSSPELFSSFFFFTDLPLATSVKAAGQM